MQLCKVRQADGRAAVGVLEAGRVRLLDGSQTLSGLLYSDDPARLAQSLLKAGDPGVAVESAALSAPLDNQEVWAAGVTYKRSREARERESAGAADFTTSSTTPHVPNSSSKRRPAAWSAPAARCASAATAVGAYRSQNWPFCYRRH